MAEHSFGTSCAPKFGRWLRANAAKLFGMDLPIVSMDESGNTGQNLLDPDQPVFALASISLTDEEARQIVGQSAEELHFAKMRKSRVGRQRVLDVLGALDPERAKVVPIHKRFMVTAKIVDQLVEPQARAVGHDGIADGSMLALANLWHLTSGTFCGEDKFERLLRAFVDCVRLRELDEGLPVGSLLSRVGPVPLSRNGRADAKGLPAEPSTELARLALQAGLPAWNTRRIPVRRWPTQAPRTPRPGDAKPVSGYPRPAR